MRMWQTLVAIPALVLAVHAADQEPAKEPMKGSAGPGTLVIVDAAGKEQKLTAWKFAAGTRRLGWLAPARAPEPKKEPSREKDENRARPAPAAPAGPEALEFRPDSEIHFVEGVVVLLPLDRLRALDYDTEQETVTAKAACAGGTDETLTGTTKYKKINKLVLEAEVDKGDLGIAEVRFFGGTPRGIRGIRFPDPRAPAAAPAGRPAVVTSVDGKKKTTHKVADLMPLYRFVGGERLLPTLMFRKTLKIDIGKVRKITITEGDRDETSWQVQLKDGGDETLVLLPSIEVDGRKGTLEGLVGRVPAGWKLFPIPSLGEVVFDATEEAPKEDK
jgi:hypothetical protein